MPQSSVTQVATGICTKDTVKKTGLNVWASGEHDGNAAEVDVIAVQGLGADPYHTWVSKPEKTKRVKLHGSFHVRGHQNYDQDDGPPRTAQTAHDTAEVMWLRDVLPSLIPHARIATYSYESDWRKADIKTSLRKCGEQLLNVLQQHRIEKERPLVFVGHSLGGLIIKQALVLADHGNTFGDIRLSTVGIIFLGTPHQGSDTAAYGVWLARAAGHDTTLLESLRKSSGILYDIARDFEASHSGTDTVCYYEEKDASYGSLRTQFVDHQSACLHGKRAMYLNTDHSGLNKFRGPDDENFLLVWPEIDRIVTNAPQKVKERYTSRVAATQKSQRQRHRLDDQEASLLETLASDYKSDKDFVSERVPGTCEWFLQDDRFLKWRDSDTSRLLWVSAGPGCGKSVLARALIDERKVCTDTTASTICYFFFKDGQEQRTRGANALSALLHQLFENTTLITHAIPTFSRYGKKLQDEFTELWEVLLKSAADPRAGDIICVLDALDECEENARNQLIGKLIYFFSQEVYQHPSLKLKFLVTSRPYDDLESKFERLSTFSTYMRFDGDEKSWMIGQEINLVIDAKIPHIAGSFDHEERKRICDRLKDMKNRTYLWLYLTIDIIEKSPSNFRRKSDIESLLSNLPTEVSDAYDRILQRSTDKAKARILLKLIVAATRLLSLEEVNVALTIATSQRCCDTQGELELWPLKNFKSDVQNWCGLFVSVHDGKLSLIHQTAREFLTETSKSARNPLHKWKGCLDMAAAHSTMSRICLSYLQFQDVASLDKSHLDRYDYDKLTEEYHLLDYAANHWATHYNSQPTDVVKASLDAAMKLCNTSSAQGWFLAYCYSKQLDLSGWTNLGIASFLGLVNVAEEFFDEGADGNAECSPKGSALLTATFAGHNQVVRMLLDKGVDINARSGPFEGRNGLQMASERGHNQIVQMLLDKGADVNAQKSPNRNVLYEASIYGRDHVVQMLVDSGAIDVDGKALKAASANDHDRIVRILLDKGATDVDGEALKEASRHGHNHLVRILLDKRRVYYVQQSNLLSSAMEEASDWGHDQVVQTLLDNGTIDVDGKALESAAVIGRDHIVRMLLDKQREYYVQHSNLLNLAMKGASRWARDGVLQLLLDKGAVDVDGKALIAASKRGRDYIVRILLEKRREYYIQHSNLLNLAMEEASERGKDQVVRTLREFQRSLG